MFTAVGQKKAFLDISLQIKNHLETGTLKVGDRLPSERKLGELFHTSRATVREALRALEIVGVIESRVGQGTFIVSDFKDNTDIIAEIEKQTSPSEVFEARFAFEPYLAKLAAYRATEEEIKQMENLLIQAGKAVEDFDIKKFEQTDGEFHYLIASSAKNSLLLRVTSIINNVRLEKLWGMLKENSLNVERMQHYQQEHKDILQSIKERDGNKAKENLLSHLKNVKSNMLED